jgi:hypothetical protein
MEPKFIHRNPYSFSKERFSKSSTWNRISSGTCLKYTFVVPTPVSWKPRDGFQKYCLSVYRKFMEIMEFLNDSQETLEYTRI